MIITAIDRDFSLYKLVQDLQPPKLFTVKRHVLAKWCAKIEMEALEQDITPAVFAGFQLLEFYLPVRQRFEDLTTISNYMAIFGQPYEALPDYDKIDVVYLSPEDQLRREWFLIICHEDFMRAIVALEITEPGTPDQDRVFEGIRTNHAKTIQHMTHALHQIIERGKAKTTNHG